MSELVSEAFVREFLPDPGLAGLSHTPGFLRMGQQPDQRVGDLVGAGGIDQQPVLAVADEFHRSAYMRPDHRLAEGHRL